MFGVILETIGTFFDEISSSIGKDKTNKREEGLYSFAFLQLFFGFLFFAALAVIYHNLFIFRSASLPTFVVRVFLEVLQLHLTVVAISRADRSTFSLVRIGTVPLLLLVDLFLGYKIGTSQAIGIGFIITGFLAVFTSRNINKKYIGVVVFGSVNAVATISLYKYNISHFNSVVGEESILMFILLVYTLFFAFYLHRENPFKLLRRSIFFAQSLSQGVGSLFESFAFAFAPASIILSAKRSSAMLWAILAGNLYFRERHIIFKLAIFVVLAAGIVLLAI